MARLRKDLTGQRFGRLIVLERAENKNGRTAYLCQCDCGQKVIKVGMDLRGGRTKSCGCLKRETGHRIGGKNAKHKMHDTRIYRIWISMRQRCNDKNARNYHNYGGRGIRICSEWDDFIKFYDWAMSQGYNDSLSIDRIDVNGNYEPSNCRWVDDLAQHNNRRDSVFLEYQGRRMTIAEWSKEIDVPYPTMVGRRRRGWDAKRILTTPSAPMTRDYTYKGKTLCLSDWAKETGIKPATLYYRMKSGWTFEQAITKPTRKIKHSQ